MHSLLKTVLRKIGDRYQEYCTMYKMHAMATHHGGAGCPVDRDINLAHRRYRRHLYLVMEAIHSEKSGEEIKDLLGLKLCNASIHTYTSHFMDIQQKEKESLAAYVHQFKTEAK